MFELTVNNIKKYMEGSLILRNISFQVYSGEKVGIVGANGSGKSTILKLIAGVLPFNYWPGYPKVSSPGYDEGWVVIPREATCAYLEQIPEYKSGLRVIDILKLAFEDIYHIENEMHELEEKMKFLEADALEKALKQYSDLTQLYEAKGGYAAEEKLSKICTGLKFSDSFLNKDFNLLSGSGKTTFLKLLFGEEKPDAGTVELGASVMAAYLPQNITFENEELTVLECFREDISIVDGKAREYLSKFMFFGGSVFKKVRQLSGGEKIRLKLSKLLYEDVNLLILDEPTNHLDIDSIETFEEALEGFNGTIFFISHDRYFINKIGERIIALEDKTFKSYAGNYDYYKKIKEDLKLQSAKKPVVKREKIKEQKNICESKKKEAETAKALKSVESLESEIKEVDLAMAEDGLSYDELNKLYNKKCELNKELDLAMELWLGLNS